MPQRCIILDTDIGSDVDDCLALALILASPECRLAAVTTVYGDTELRARMALKLLKLRGIPNIPVAAGAQQPLLGHPPVYWAGYEGQGLLEQEETGLQPLGEHAVDLIVRTVMEHPGEITLVAIGPLTNIATALLREPDLARSLAGLALMGGVIGGVGSLDLPWTEHNFRSDPEAAQIVLRSGAPLTIVPLDVTTQVRIWPADTARIYAAGDRFHRAVADQIARYPRYQARGWTYLHDPTAAAAVLRPQLLTCRPLHAVVETGGQFCAGKLLVKSPTGADSATAQVALAVAAADSQQFIIDRLIG